MRPVEVASSKFGAGKGTRTLDPDLGKVVLYQLSYSRNVVLLYPSMPSQGWRPRSESNRRRRICNPLHNHSATRPEYLSQKWT